MGLTYSVNYGSLDPFKVLAQRAADFTDDNILDSGYTVVPWSRGESAFLVKDQHGQYFGFVVEGLGTKSLVADRFALQYEQEIMTCPTQTYWRHLAQCNVAMAVNDLITLGVRPVVYNLYLAVGDDTWFDDRARQRGVVEGTASACRAAGCVWGGGETPQLSGIITPGTVDLAGSAFGIADEKNVINPERIRSGDAIVFIGSSGIHANGLTMARKIAEKLPNGYFTKLGNGQTYGDTLLASTTIYVGFMRECANRGVRPSYAVNITGHGWRKLMRAPQPFAYVIHELPEPQSIFYFIQEQGSVEDVEMYGTFNMGVGFAVYVPEADVRTVIDAARSWDLKAFRAGHVESSATRRVCIEPLQLEYEEKELAVR